MHRRLQLGRAFHLALYFLLCLNHAARHTDQTPPRIIFDDSKLTQRLQSAPTTRTRDKPPMNETPMNETPMSRAMNKAMNRTMNGNPRGRNHTHHAQDLQGQEPQEILHEYTGEPLFNITRYLEESQASCKKDPSDKPRVAICVYGLVQRSLKYTYESIQEKVLDNLAKEGFEYDIFGHTYEVPLLTNAWSNEKHHRLRLEDLNYINFTTILVQNETLIDAYLDFPYFQKYGLFVYWKRQSQGAWDPLYNSLRQLYSLEQSWHLMNNYALSCKLQYHAVIFLRADCLFKTPVTLKNLQISDNTAFIPAYHSKLDEVYNDKFAITSARGSFVLATRLHSAKHFCFNAGHGRPFHSESLLYYHMQLNMMQRADYNISICRVRSNGVVQKSSVDSCIHQ
eukprot:TRINITY_DN13575_c0_g1_i1.p1 TRINITY_DN13575_c0_g1~~TRINITY_DN13575_c0_g1_i1.p1  ORF type:complete len:396 (+),score=80.74 TRINITY_DN13575_c0_g1_i1:55-1242(+)